MKPDVSPIVLEGMVKALKELGEHMLRQTEMLNELVERLDALEKQKK